MNGDLLRIVEVLHREKDIDKEVIFQGIEAAVASATKKHYGRDAEIRVVVDRETGALTAYEEDRLIDPEELGRIAAQSAKQMMIQKIREAESNVIYDDFEDRKNTIITGQVQRYEGGNMIANLGRVEGVLSRRDLIPGDSYRPGDRIRALVTDVRKDGSKVRIILSRTDPEFIIKLFELEVPEIVENLVVVRAIARNPGYRTKIAIESMDPRIDCVGACVGVRGSRIRNVVSELNGEKVDIIQWDDQPANLIVNALKPAEISSLEMDEEARVARVIVASDQLSLAIGKRGQNVRLASKLSGWQLDIISEEERQAVAEALLATLRQAPEIPDETANLIASSGYMSVKDLLTRGAETLAATVGIEQKQADGMLQALRRHLDDGSVKAVQPVVPDRKKGEIDVEAPPEEERAEDSAADEVGGVETAVEENLEAAEDAETAGEEKPETAEDAVPSGEEIPAADEAAPAPGPRRKDLQSAEPQENDTK